jgi:hypothetical protein
MHTRTTSGVDHSHFSDLTLANPRLRCCIFVTRYSTCVKTSPKTVLKTTAQGLCLVPCVA